MPTDYLSVIWEHMFMKVEKTKLDGVLIITPDVFKDHRGEYIETWNEAMYPPLAEVCGEPCGCLMEPQPFVQDDISISHHNVLRGIHGDEVTWKLVSCLYGTICLVVVNWDQESPQYKSHTQFILSDINHQQVLIPPKFGNGHLVLSDKAIFHYKQSTYYDSESQFTIRYNDPELDIPWPILLGKPPITSERDR